VISSPPIGLGKERNPRRSESDNGCLLVARVGFDHPAADGWVDAESEGQVVLTDESSGVKNVNVAIYKIYRALI